MTDAPDLLEGGICPRCGYSHAPDDRRRFVARQLPATFDDLRQAWPCFYPVSQAGGKRLQRDLEALGAVFGGSTLWRGMWHLPDGVQAPAQEPKPAEGVSHQRLAEAKVLLEQFARAATSEAELQRKLGQALSLQRALLGQLRALGVARRFAARRWVLAHGGNPRDERQVRQAKQRLLMRFRSSP